MSNFHLDDIATDILEQRCALLLGPEILTVGGKPVTEAFREYLLQKHGRHILHVFERESVYKFADEKSKKRIQTEGVKGFYEQTRPDDAVLQKVLAIPFHLVLQVTPDTFLSDAGHLHSIKHEFKYFCGGGKSVESVEKPSSATPLFYNLCGTRDRYDSMLLDYDDMFAFLKSAFGNPGLPENLRTALSECTTFLFLGFQLDKWYTQLLTRWVSDNVKGADRFANAYDFGMDGEDAKEFVRLQLEIVTVGKEHVELLDDLYKHFRQTKNLRKLSDPISPNTLSVRRLIQHGNIEKALEVYLQLSSSVGERDVATLLSSEYQDLKRGREQYALTDEKFWERSQNLKFRLLSQMEQHSYSL